MRKAFVAAALVAFALAALSGCGRTRSRYLGKSQAQTLEIPNMRKFISVSFYLDGGATVKDVTFEAADGYVYTQEFRDATPREGVIRWVPADHSESLLRSRALSRWTGKPVNMRLPGDCKQVLGVSVSVESKDVRVKNLTYLSADDAIYSKEYREGVINKRLGGWLKIVPKP